MKKRLFIALLIIATALIATSCSMQALEAGEIPEQPGNVMHYYAVDYLEGNQGEVRILAEDEMGDGSYCIIHIYDAFAIDTELSWMEYDGKRHQIDSANPFNTAQGLTPNLLRAYSNQIWIGPTDWEFNAPERLRIPVTDFILYAVFTFEEGGEAKAYKVHVHPHDPSEYDSPTT